MEAPLSPENLAFVESLLASYRRDPQSVASEWRSYFEAHELDAGHAVGPQFKPTSIFGGGAPTAAAPRPSLQPTAGGSGDVPAELAPTVALLSEVSIFKSLPRAELAQIAAVVTERSCEDGEVLMAAGDPGESLFIVVSGTLVIERNEQVLASITEGQVVGELAVLDKQPRSADVRAHGKVRLLELHARDLERLLDQSGQLARSLFTVVSKRLRDSRAQQQRVDQLVRSYRVRGHAIAQLDPLGRRPNSHPELELEYHGLEESDMDQLFACPSYGCAPVATLREILSGLQAAYCGHVAVQFMHIDDLSVQTWLKERLEDPKRRPRLGHEDQRRILTRLTEAELFEGFIHAKFLGAKRFSLEGGESLIPLLDMAIEEAAEHGVEQLVLGMAHRGRLNVLANIMGKKPQEIFAEFMDPESEAEQYTGKGDVKYHMGFNSSRETVTGKQVHLSLTFNPSHLEFVTPVVQGRVRAKQDRQGDSDRSKVMGLVVHGDAAFSGQGVVQESFNMSGLPGYRSGGTIHVIFNNQIGFTTLPEQSRSSPYATDVAKMLEIPILHVNGEHPEAVARAIKLALEFRKEFKRDVVLDMYCYRRHGHNEGDEPRFTQPLMYKWIDSQPSVREAHVQNLVSQGEMSQEECDEIATKCRGRLEAALEEVRASARGHRGTQGPHEQGAWEDYHGGHFAGEAPAETAVARDTLAKMLSGLTELPGTFKAHRTVKRLLKQRVEMALGDRSLDWGAAEALALGTIVAEGTRVRLSGQDAGRGTFSHRHAELHDQDDGSTHVPLQHVSPEQAQFDVWNSPLSETSVLGFDFGYSLEWPDGLTLWEAQFGDFANAAQVIIDQFITTVEDKWSRLSGLVMLLPHGFEGQGPEHSSARLERFLMLSADDNIRVVNLTTPAQVFHCLRRQSVSKLRKPLVVMSPKSLLRHPAAVSSLEELAQGGFKELIGDAEVPLERASRVLACSGKVYYDLLEARKANSADDVAILRVEQLYPFPREELKALLSDCPDSTPVYWVQEEPRNMGAWPYLRMRFGDRLFGKQSLGRITRPESASPATGSGASHALEQAQLMNEALGLDGSLSEKTGE